VRIERRFYLYILASKSRRLYIGMTSSLEARVLQHKCGSIPGFAQRYRINRLVYYEVFKYVDKCIARETELKKWRRAKKVALLERENPTWEDLAVHWGKPIKQVPPLRFAASRNDKIKGEESLVRR